MAKTVEITFAIGAALAGSFAGTFGKAGKALADFQKQAEQVQKQSAQIELYQKTQGAIVKNSAEMQTMYDKAEALNAQAALSKTRTQELSSQFRTAQQETSRLNAENVRNTDAYKAAQLNMKSLANQIANAKQPTAELQRQYKVAQEEVRRLEGAMKNSSEAVKAARKNEQDLSRQVKESKRETKSLTDESKGLTEQGDKLKQTIDRDMESLSRMTAELKTARIDTRDLAGEQARLTQQSQRMAEAQARYQRSKAALDQTKQNLSWNNMKGELMTAAGLGYSLYKPVSQAADFESAMARVNAVAFSGAGRDKEADAKSFQALSEQARQLGRDTQFTAVQAAQSQENLARAGFKANEIIAAMPGLLNMAAAEGMDLATAADVAASTLRGFKLSADQANRVADVLAQTSAASNTSIVGLGEGMKYVAPVAANLGVSLEETSAMLGVMANAGIKGTEGGTALRGAFLRLAQEPKAVEKALNSLGVASRDAKGNMRQLPDLMLELSNKMKDMGEADKTKYLADIFGVRAVSGMMAVMNGALDGSLEQLRRYNYEATGELKAISEAVGVSTEKMWEGMKGSEPFMQRLGISFRDLSIYTAMLAKSGIKGAVANDVLTATFSRLAKDSNSVQKALKGYNISLFKDDGTMRDFPDLLNDINNAIRGMNEAKQIEAITKIFGAEAMPGAQALLAQLGAGTFTELDKKAEGAKGVAYEMMQKQLATLKGQMDIAKSAISDVMIEIGNAILPIVTAVVSGFSTITAGFAKFMKGSDITKWVVRIVGGLAALKVGIVAVKYAWLMLKLPFLSARVAMDLLNLKLVAQGKTSLFAAAKTKILAGATKAWQLVMKAGSKLLDVGKLALYYGKQLLIAGTTKAWTAAQWLWNAAMTANPIGLIIAAIAGAITIGYLLYKNWDKLKALWNSWTIKDVFAVIKDYAFNACNYVKGKWNEFWAWWDSWELPDVFAALGGYIDEGIAYIKGQWNKFTDWLSSLNPFKDWTPPAIDPEVAKTMKAETLQKYGTFDLTPTYMRGDLGKQVKNLPQPNAEQINQAKSASNTSTKAKPIQPISEQEIKRQIENITILNNMSEGFSQRVSEMTAAWQPFKDSLGEGFSQIYTVMQGVADRIRETVIPAVNELVSALSRVATEIGAIVQAGNIEVDVRTPNQGMGNNVPMQYQRMLGGRKRAEGGFITQPEIALIGEAGREVVIPLEKQSRGTELWLQAGRELGLISNTNITNNYPGQNTEDYNALPQIVNAMKFQPEISNIIPHATGGIFTQPHIGLVAEAGSEAIIPLEDKSRGLPLWMAAGEELGFSFGGSSSNSNMSFTFNPTVSVTVNGGEPDSDSKFRRILSEMFEELFLDFQERMQRLAFE
ncbi:MAG: phage tail tape measure protein [Synergistaceae bacterium]|nr:phage tail tape measure protein [Synergistaceae bacterium]